MTHELEEVSFGGNTYTLLQRAVVKKGFWCRHGLHGLKRWGNDFDQLEVCKRCGAVFKTHIFYGFMEDHKVSNFLGYIDPERLFMNEGRF